VLNVFSLKELAEVEGSRNITDGIATFQCNFSVLSIGYRYTVGKEKKYTLPFVIFRYTLTSDRKARFRGQM
jgi:hypothetical protein